MYGITDEQIKEKRLEMKARGLKCPHTKNARRRLINERKRLLTANNSDDCPVVSVLEDKPVDQ